jgi:hypothetical protein
LKITPDKFLSDYTDHRWPGTESFLLVHVNEACIFMMITPDTNLSLCRIHAFKPASCCAWEAGAHKSECQKGLKTSFGITVDSTAKLQASDEQLKKLAERIENIKAI